METRIKQALRQTTKDYGIATPYLREKSLIKFGRNTDLGTDEETIWLRGGLETYPTTNSIDRIVSSSASDTHSVVVEGHYFDGNGDLIFTTQEVTLNGQTPVALSTDLCRATRIFNDNSSDLVGTVYVYEDSTVSAGVPTDLTKIHVQCNGSINQSLKAATSISSTDFWIITKGIFSVDRTKTVTVDFRPRFRKLGKVFRPLTPPFSVNSQAGTVVIDFNPCIIVPNNSDFVLNAIASQANTVADGSLWGYLVSYNRIT